jgi:putative ABC transport system permease protein
MRSILLDLTDALRALRAAPFFTCVAAGTLSLAIALNAIIFTLVQSILLKPLPYPAAGQLVVLRGQVQSRHEIQDLVAPAFFFVKQNVKLLEGVAALYPTEVGVNLNGLGRRDYVQALHVSADFFHTLRVSPMLGRTFDDQEDRPGGGRVVVLSYALWRRSFPDKPRLGSGWRLNGEEYTVIGVMPESFRSIPDADLWLPLQLSPTQADPGKNYRVVARIRDGSTAQQAGDELRELSKNLPSSRIVPGDRAVLVLQTLQEFAIQGVRPPLIFLWSAVFFAFLIVCSNIAMLLLVRAVGRSHEVGIRLALGSSRWRLVQLFFLESCTISVLGGLLGGILGKELLPLVLFYAPSNFPLLAKVHLDWHVVVFTWGLSALAAVLFGATSAIRLSRVDMKYLLGTKTYRVTAGAGQMRTARSILVVQITLTMVLLACAVMFLRHLIAVESVAPGFDKRGVSVAQVALVGRSYTASAGTAGVLDSILKQLQALPFVESAAGITGLPLETGLNVPGHPEGEPQTVDAVEYRSITQDYFLVMRIPMLQGRPFATSDGSQTQPVAIVNETLARKWWPKRSALGRFIALGEEIGPEFADRHRLVVGVVADIHESSLEQSARPTIFVPAAQVPDSIEGYTNQHFLTSIVIRTSRPANVLERVRAAIEFSDPDLALASFHPLSQILTNSISRDRFYTFLTVLFGIFALLATMVGLSGLLSYEISLSEREIGVRISFGANRFHVLILVIKQSLKLTVPGAALGMAGGFFGVRLAAHLLYNLPKIGFGALGGAVALLALITLLASSVAAVRTTAIEPALVLRDE